LAKVRKHKRNGYKVRKHKRRNPKMIKSIIESQRTSEEYQEALRELRQAKELGIGPYKRRSWSAVIQERDKQMKQAKKPRKEYQWRLDSARYIR
jgi:hypothetical protein